LVLIAAASYTSKMLHTTACCAVGTVYDMVQAGNTLPTPAHVLKILCANYVKQQMRRLFTRRDRSRSPRVCERVCERLGLFDSRENSPTSPRGTASNQEEIQNPADLSQRDDFPSTQEDAPEFIPLPALPPQGDPPEFIALQNPESPHALESKQEESELKSLEFIPLQKANEAGDNDEEEPSNSPVVRGAQIVALMSRVVRFFSLEDSDDGSRWLECARRFPELQDMITAYQRWRTARNALCALTDEGPVRDFEVAVAALMSFVDMSMHEDEEEDDDEGDEQDESDDVDDSEESAELCCDTSSDDDETSDSCEQDPCFIFLHSLGANVTPARFRHLERFRTAFAGRPDGTMREVCMFMLQNLECECLGEEPSLLHTWVDATAHALISGGSDKCEVIVANRAFFTLERRWPTLSELQDYAGRQRMQSGDPDRFYREERFAVPTPHLDRLVSTPADHASDCAICGHLVEVASECYLLSCGHQFHAVDCLGDQNIRSWLSMNRRCPVCRVEVAL
jgi:hypothetical protein